MIRALTFAALLLALNASAATYYIDFDGGSDSNAGTSTGAAWKRHPRMLNSTGTSAAHVGTPGDIYIFKGGVTWTSSFPLTLSVSGTTASWYQMKGDASWYTGGSWSRPIFDGSSNQVNLITFSGIRSNWFIADLDMQNYSHAVAIFSPGIRFTTLSNLYIHKWWTGGHDGSDSGGGCDEWFFGGIRNHIYGAPGPNNWRYILTHSTINNQDGYNVGLGGTNGYGMCITGIGEAYYSEFAYGYYLQMHGGYIFAHNDWHHMGISQRGIGFCHDDFTYLDSVAGYSPGSSPPTSRVLFYNNRIYDIPGWTSQAIYPNQGDSGISAGCSYYVFNNVLTRVGSQYPISSDNYHSPAGNNHQIYYFNNTIHANHQGAGKAFIRAVDNDSSPSAPPYRIWMLNNLLISDPAAYPKSTITVDTDADGGSVPTDAKYAWNTNFSSGHTALAGGYATNNNFAPSSAAALGVGAGTNLYQFCLDHSLPAEAFSDTSHGLELRATVSRPTSGAWDIGAYQYGAAAPVITASQTAYGPNGSPFDYQVLSSGGVVSWGASNLPSGLSMNGSSGIISGTPSVVGTNTVLLAATNANGWDQEFMTIGITNPAAVIAVEASSFDYGQLMMTRTEDIVIGITNVGGSGTTLTGSATNPVGPYTIIGDAGYSLANGASDTVTLRYSPTTYGTNFGSVSFTGGGGATVALLGYAYAKVTVGTAYPAVQTLFYSPFTTNGNVLKQSIETINAQGGGLALWGFTLDGDGVVSVTGEIYAPNLGSDSYFLDIDTLPDASFIWDVIPTNSVHTPSLANARGLGTYDMPEFQPKYWTLSSGDHYLVFYGREQNCSLTNITVNFSATTMAQPGPRLRGPKLKIRR